jgi:hypothetical protein
MSVISCITLDSCLLIIIQVAGQQTKQYILRIEDIPAPVPNTQARHHELYFSSSKKFGRTAVVLNEEHTIEMEMESRDQGHDMLDHFEGGGAAAAQQLNCKLTPDAVERRT